MGAFSIWHWLIVLLVIGVPIFIIWIIVRKSNQTISELNPNMTVADYRSSQSLGAIVIWFFVASIVADLLSAGSSVMQIDLLQRMGGGVNWSQAEAEANDNREAIIGWIVSAISLGGMICFLIWFHCVRANLPALGISEARWSPRWAVGWWLIPIFGFFRPYQIAKEVWKASSLTVTTDNWREGDNPSILKIWWGLYVFGSILYNVSGRMAITSFLAKEPTLDQLVNASIMDIVATSVWVVATFPAILVVKKISRRQEERASFLVGGPKSSHVNAERRASEIEAASLTTEEHAISAVPIPNQQTPSASSQTFKPGNTEPHISQANSDGKECPRCAEIIKRKAKYCRFCNYEYSETEFETEKKRFDDALKQREELARNEIEERCKSEAEARGVSYKGYKIRKTERGHFEVFEHDIKVKGSKDYAGIVKAKQYIDLISGD